MFLDLGIQRAGYLFLRSMGYSCIEKECSSLPETILLGLYITTARPWIPTGTPLPSFLDFDRRHDGIFSYLSPIFGDVVYLCDSFLYLCLDLVDIFLI